MAWWMCAALLADPAAFPVGKSKVELRVGSVPLTCYVYRPETYRDGPLILVFHGVLRNAEEYRDHAVAMADRFQALIVAPKFDEPRFPKEKYQFGNVVQDGKPVPADERTGAMIPKLAAQIRERMNRPELPYYLIGHSGGGQFVFRLSAFVDTEAKEIVSANAGTLIFPRTDLPFPYGLGGLPDELTNAERLQRFVGQRLTLYLGDRDIIRDEDLQVGPDPDAQGSCRFERNFAGFRAWQELAREKGWDFRWRIVIANGVEHDHEKMFNNPMCQAALFGRK